MKTEYLGKIIQTKLLFKGKTIYCKIASKWAQDGVTFVGDKSIACFPFLHEDKAV